MLMRGLDINATDYDKRTTLHLACAEGNLKVVELLIAEGANVHAIDRYGNNGLHYAVVNNHSLIADLLARNGAELSYKKPADAICGAAGRGNMDRIRVLVKVRECEERKTKALRICQLQLSDSLSRR